MGLILLYFIVSKEVQKWQPLVFIGVYAAYVLTVLTTKFVKKRKRRRAEEEARAGVPNIANTADDCSLETELKPIERLDVLKRSSPSISRRSVVISSFSGNPHEIVIEYSEEKSSDDFIITHQESQKSRKSKSAAQTEHQPYVIGVISDLLSYFAPPFEDEEPSRIKTYFCEFQWPIVALFKLTVPLSTSAWSKPVAIILSILSPQCFLFNTQ
ncbi:hypothetical protein PENTCL1PPCAC_14213 [Pristionchus entomophagus]|uniref:Uncharacterized protein n=1 Tax=Pristionchus entomophagus TaxID=358040 RepID=A0AAV5TDV2_9BILA|nr:hypothetical protein PENTCL1PPCAC_14213 [Pristionchus entomophagus]